MTRNDSSDKDDKMDGEEEEEESGEVDSSSGEESSSPAVVHPRTMFALRHAKLRFLSSLFPSGRTSSYDTCTGRFKSSQKY